MGSEHALTPLLLPYLFFPLGNGYFIPSSPRTGASALVTAIVFSFPVDDFILSLPPYTPSILIM